MQKLTKISKVVWLICGVLFIGVLVSAIVQLNLICGDIRNVTSQMSIQDLRQSLDIAEKSLDIQKLEIK